jgi:hypothetical protein
MWNQCLLGCVRESSARYLQFFFITRDTHMRLDHLQSAVNEPAIVPSKTIDRPQPLGIDERSDAVHTYAFPTRS